MPGQIVHIEIPADDTAKAREFWGSLFGWQFEAFPGGPSEYHMTRTSDTSGAAITNMEPGKRGTRAYFDVDDIDAGTARVRELGGHADEKMPVPGMGWFSTCTDPQGNEFGLCFGFAFSAAWQCPSPPGGVAWHGVESDDEEPREGLVVGRVPLRVLGVCLARWPGVPLSC